MAIRISGTTGIDMGNTSVSNVDSGVIGTNAATIDYVKNNSDISAITSYSQISGTSTIEGVELTNNIHDIFGDGSAVATYQLNGNANDLGGNYNGTATNVIYEEGKFGQAAVFNGSSKIDTGITNSASGYSISMFLEIPSISGGPQGVFNMGGSRELYTQSNSLYFRDTGIALFGVEGSLLSSGFHNVVVTANNTICKIYIDNVVVGSQSVSSLVVSDNIILGERLGGALKLTGSMDQVRIFNRALTEQEVQTLYTETRVSEDTVLNINQGIFIYPKGLASRGYLKSSDIFTGIVPTSGVSDGWKYVAKDENGNFSFYTTKPTLGKTSAELYLKDGKLYQSSDDTEITPISFLSNKVRFASSVPLELAPSGIAKSVTDSIEANKLIMNGMEAYACRAWVNFNGTGTVAIRAMGNVSSITDNGTGDYTVNFTTAMVDANYSVNISDGNATPGEDWAPWIREFTTSSVRFYPNGGVSPTDREFITVAIFR